LLSKNVAKITNTLPNFQKSDKKSKKPANYLPPEGNWQAFSLLMQFHSSDQSSTIASFGQALAQVPQPTQASASMT